MVSADLELLSVAVLLGDQQIKFIMDTEASIIYQIITDIVIHPTNILIISGNGQQIDC